MLTRAEELSNLCRGSSRTARTASLQAGARKESTHLEAARRTAEVAEEGRLTRTWRNQGICVRTKPRQPGCRRGRYAGPRTIADLEGALPSIQAHVNRFFQGRPAPHGGRRDRTRQERDARGRATRPPHRGSPANTQRRRDLIRLRGFRNLMLGAIVLFSVIAIALGLVGSFAKTTIPLCFTPEAEGRVKSCARRRAASRLGRGRLRLRRGHQGHGDARRRLAGGLMGLLGAALAGAATLRTIRGTSTPYGVPIALAGGQASDRRGHRGGRADPARERSSFPA